MIAGSSGSCPGLSASSEMAIRVTRATDRLKICVWKINSSYEEMALGGGNCEFVPYYIS